MTQTNGHNRALHLATQSGWYKFERRGKEWVQVDRSLTYWTLTCLAVDPADPKMIYAGSEHSGLFVTSDGGTSWRRADPNVPHLMLSSLLAISGNILAGTSPAALYCARSGSKWEELEDVRRGSSHATFPPSPGLGSRTRYLAADPVIPMRLYAGIEVGGLLMSDDGGKSWGPANEGLTDPDVHQLLPCGQTPELVLAACGEGVFRSLDRAAHWHEITPTGSRTYGTAVAESNEGTIYLGIARGRPNTWLRPERADAAIFFSPQAGARWEPVVEGLRGAVMDICEDPEGDGVIAGTSDGDLLAMGNSGLKVLASGLPCITALELGA
ncbi:MAG: hypothetical protein V3W08_06540 [Candidatus Binatia bacterium]|jgi:photosystem II stability/assembly factor-like uncharacterized protein